MKHNPRLYALVKKTIRIIGFVPKRKIGINLTEQQAFDLEFRSITNIGKFPNGPLLNLTDGGDGASNPTSEVRIKLRNRWLGKKHSKETREKMSAWQRGRKLSDEHRKNISNARLGIKLNLNKRQKRDMKIHLQRIRKLRKYGPPSNATRLKISIGNKGKKVSNISRLRISLGNIGKKMSEEARNKMRLSWANTREKRCLSMKLGWIKRKEKYYT